MLKARMDKLKRMKEHSNQLITTRAALFLWPRMKKDRKSTGEGRGHTTTDQSTAKREGNISNSARDSEDGVKFHLDTWTGISGTHSKKADTAENDL